MHFFPCKDGSAVRSDLWSKSSGKPFRGASLSSRTPVRSRAGFTLLELAVVVPILIIAVALLSGTLTGTTKQRSILRENSVASNAIQSVIETMRNDDFRQLFALYNEEPFDDPNGPGTAPGNRFAVDGLDPQPGAVNGMIGEIILPTFNAGGAIDQDWQLREDIDLPILGLPRDLNGDNIVDALNHADDYTIMPIEVRLQWQGRYGPREFRMQTLLVDWDA